MTHECRSRHLLDSAVPHADGMKGKDDPRFMERFTRMYDAEGLQVPWYAVLGNHDYGDGNSGDADWERCNGRSWEQCETLGCCPSPVWQVRWREHEDAHRLCHQLPSVTLPASIPTAQHASSQLPTTNPPVVCLAASTQHASAQHAEHTACRPQTSQSAFRAGAVVLAGNAPWSTSAWACCLCLTCYPRGWWQWSPHDSPCSGLALCHLAAPLQPLCLTAWRILGAVHGAPPDRRQAVALLQRDAQDDLP